MDAIVTLGSVQGLKQDNICASSLGLEVFFIRVNEMVAFSGENLTSVLPDDIIRKRKLFGVKIFVNKASGGN